MNELIRNIEKLHTTKLGVLRIQGNLKIDEDVIEYSKRIIFDDNCNINKKGKNYYCELNDVVLTINSYSYTIITAHKKR